MTKYFEKFVNALRQIRICASPKHLYELITADWVSLGKSFLNCIKILSEIGNTFSNYVPGSAVSSFEGCFFGVSAFTIFSNKNSKKFFV